MSTTSPPPPEPQLPTTLQLHILSFLPHNDRVLSGRLVSPDLRDALTGPDHCTASLSQSLPPHAVPWAVEAGQQHVRQLSFYQKPRLLTTAAASGSEVNLEVAWALLQPSVFPELLQGCYPTSQPDQSMAALDPGTAAVKAGHPQLLDWLLRHCPAKLMPNGILEAAARHCDLAGLQLAWGLLQEGCGGGGSGNDCRCPALGQGVLDAAAESVTPDAVAKMEWVLETAGEGTCHLQRSTAVAAARSGDLGRLRWLRDRGCPMGGVQVLESALEHADLAVAQWLVDEAGCELPQAGTAGSPWATLLLASARSPECAPKWQWLCDRGGLLTPSPELLRSLSGAVVQHGRVEGLRALQLFPGMQTAEGRAALQQALDQEEGPRCIAMAMQLRQAGYRLTPKAYLGAARTGDVAMVRWLAGVPIGGAGIYDLVKRWPCDTVARSRELLQAVQLLVGQAWHQDVTTAFSAAVRIGNQALAQYLLQLLPGYRPTHPLVRVAVESGCEALLEWLVEQPGCRALLDQHFVEILYCIALRQRDRGTLTALRRLGVSWDVVGNVVVQAVVVGCEMPVLRWLVEQGAPVGSAESLAWVLAQEVKHGRRSAEDAEEVQRMAERQRHVPAGPAVTASRPWAWLWRRLLGWW